MKKMSILILAVFLTLALAGYASAQVTVQVGSTASTPQGGDSFTTGSIYVVSTPPGSSAVLDGGEDQLLTPGTFSSVQPGIHNVEIAMPGYQPSLSVVNGNCGNNTKRKCRPCPGCITRKYIAFDNAERGRFLYR